jgi:hypothetical protein
MMRLQPKSTPFNDSELLVSSWGRGGLISRVKAAVIHLVISAFVALAITIPIVFWLYPSPFFEAAGGLNLLGIILGIDIILGPCLTFFVFNRAKKSLGFDLKVIASLQIAALVYGLYATAASRPVYMTYVVDRFEMVSAADVDPDELAKAPPEIQQVRWGHPQLAYAEQPTSEDERSTIVFSALNGVDLNRLFRYYKPFELAKAKILERSKPVQNLNQFNAPEVVDKVLKPFSKEGLAFVPMQGRKRDLTVLVNAQTGDLVQVVDLRPWSDAK